MDTSLLRLKNYFAFMAPVSDYFAVMWHNKRLFLYEWATPILLAFLSIDREGSVIIKSFNLGFIVTLLGSLMAFSIALLTLILTFSETVTVELKKRETDVMISDKHLSLYQLMFTNTSYSIVVEGILIMFTMFFMVHTSWMSWLSVSITILFTAQVILINMRTITNVYLVYMKPAQKDKIEDVNGQNTEISHSMIPQNTAPNTQSSVEGMEQSIDE
ncbi:MAG: hypothetical protein PHD21_05725 [Flavobacteriales bacterium]|nr:hypothetical protein [Flavobacteriales bacterium]